MPRQLNDVLKVYMEDGDCLTDNRVVFQAGGMYSKKFKMWFPETERTKLYRWVGDDVDLVLSGAINVQTDTPPAPDDNDDLVDKYLTQVIDEYSAGVGEDQLSAKRALGMMQVAASGAGILFVALAFFSQMAG